MKYIISDGFHEATQECTQHEAECMAKVTSQINDSRITVMEAETRKVVAAFRHNKAIKRL